VRLPAAPDAPSFRELGYAVSPAIFYGVGGPAGLPAEVSARWEALVRDACETERMKGLIGRLKMIPDYAPADRFRTEALQDFELMGGAIRQVT
jgi:tripartite-type tricarboxylate transporter receptor subunit TctC